MNFCKIGFHKYESIEIQTLKNTISFNDSPIIREKLICKKCGKFLYKRLSIYTPMDIILNDKLEWI